MIFYDNDHKTAYDKICEKMNHLDCYHRSLAYLLALDTVCREHVEDVFDYTEDGIKTNGLEKAWQTGTSKRTTRLAFNLWNGFCCGEDGKQSSDYTPESLFVYADYAPYYWQAVQIRFDF